MGLIGWFKWAGRTWEGGAAFNEADIGQPFELSKALSARVGDLGLRLERTAERNNRLRVVATLGDEVTRIPLESLPYSVKRYDIRLLSAGRKKARLEVFEIPKFTNARNGQVDRVTMDLIRATHDREAYGPYFQWDDPPSDITTDIEENENQPPEAFGDDAEGSAFTVDVGPFIKWPQGVTEYVVHAEYGPYRSNEIRTTIRNEG